VLVELAPGHEAWIFNTHLFHAPYGPYQLNGIAYNGGRLYDPSVAADIENVIRDPVRARGTELASLLSSAAGSGALASDSPVFLTGDFNEPSHLDWTADAVAARVHVAEIAWPTSLAIAEQGFRDAWREVYPDELAEPGRTWSPVYPSTYLNRGDNTAQQPRPVLEPQDRIDMVYYRGANIVSIDARRSGPSGGDVVEEWEMVNYPSDHNAMTSTFRLSGLDATRLTFRNLGASGDAIPGGYGNRVLSSPNIAVAYSARGGAAGEEAAWKFWDDAVWPDVTYLDSGDGESADGTAVFELLLTPDDGFGVVVPSFRLFDYADGNGMGQTVDWEVRSGDGVPVAAGAAIIPLNGHLDVETGLSQALIGPMTLRLTHRSGVNNELALDDFVFRQTVVPEPVGMLAAAIAAALVGIAWRHQEREAGGI
jgi:hypothetical protein